VHQGNNHVRLNHIILTRLTGNRYKHHDHSWWITMNQKLSMTELPSRTSPNAPRPISCPTRYLRPNKTMRPCALCSSDVLDAERLSFWMRTQETACLYNRSNDQKPSVFWRYEQTPLQKRGKTQPDGFDGWIETLVLIFTVREKMLGEEQPQIR